MFRKFGKSNKLSGIGRVFWAVLYFSALVIMGAYLIFAFIVRPIDKAINTRTVTGTVLQKTAKHAVLTDVLLVIVEDETGTIVPLEVTNSLLRRHFNNVDIYGNICEGQKYTFEVGGSYWNWLFWYPNIYDFQEVE